MDNPVTEFEESPLEIHDLDELLPSNDHSAITEQRLKREIEACSRHLKPRMMSAITAHVNGVSTRNAAEKYHMTPNTLRNNINSPRGQQLISALRRLYSLRDGTKYRQRELMLWRIASANEQIDPRTSISAIAEINRTKHDTPDAEHKSKQEAGVRGQPQIIIQLQDSRLKASPLDELPPHMQPIKDVN